MWHYLVLFFPIEIPSFVSFIILLVITPWIIYKLLKFFFTSAIPSVFHCYKRLYRCMEEYLDDLHSKELHKHVAALSAKAANERSLHAVVPEEKRPLIDYEPRNEIPLRAKLVTLYFFICVTVVLLTLYTFIKNH